MAEALNRQDLFAVGRRYIVTALNPKVNPTQVDVDGSDINLMLGACSLMGEEIVRMFVTAIRGMFSDTAFGDALARLASDRYSLNPKPATSASVDLLLARPTSAGGAGTIDAGALVTTGSGIQFSLDTDAVFGSTDLSKTVSATALIVGTNGNVTAGSITSFASSPFDSTIQVTQPLNAAGGYLAETATQFKARIKGFWPTVRRGVLGAIEYGATLVPGVAVATAYEAVNPSGLPAGLVQLVIADVNGSFSTPLLQAVTDQMLEFRSGGIPVVVLGGVVTYVPVTWKLSYVSGINTDQAQEDVRAVTVATPQFLKAGATLLRSSLISAGQTVPGAVVSSDSMVAPAGDIIPAQNNYLLRIRPSDVSFL